MAVGTLHLSKQAGIAVSTTAEDLHHHDQLLLHTHQLKETHYRGVRRRSRGTLNTAEAAAIAYDEAAINLRGPKAKTTYRNGIIRSMHHQNHEQQQHHFVRTRDLRRNMFSSN
ncbi:hypothetical protein MKW98_019962 [Papaver atlanticum]|uniref:AP2/ERF domain-containing protein n=1 Tax=Papaver atlanticum TaxID=357466 RepID=A0AAD4S147_9MAGN|nr:hypothetical protein MKW98_019962 [Papaver atlanticum]